MLTQIGPGSQVPGGCIGSFFVASPLLLHATTRIVAVSSSAIRMMFRPMLLPRKQILSMLSACYPLKMFCWGVVTVFGLLLPFFSSIKSKSL